MQKPIDRLKRKIEKENLWIFILSSLKEGEKYGKELRRQIKEKFGFITGTVTAYKVVYLLEKGGYTRSRKRGRKKYYHITAKGREELGKVKEQFRKYLKNV